MAAPAGSKLVKIFVATNRDRKSPETNIFTNRRAYALNYAVFTIAIPADHRPGRVELAGLGGPGFIAGSSRRVGSLDVKDPRVDETVKQARIQVFDISRFSSTDGLGHDRFVQLAALYPQLAKRPIISETGVFLIDTAGAVVRAPLEIVDAPD